MVVVLQEIGRRKGQLQGVDKRDVRGQVALIVTLLGMAA
jgi:hypothetical protein